MAILSLRDLSSRSDPGQNVNPDTETFCFVALSVSAYRDHEDNCIFVVKKAIMRISIFLLYSTGNLKPAGLELGSLD